MHNIIGIIAKPGVTKASISPVSDLIAIISTLTGEQIPLVTGGTLRVLENDERVRIYAVDSLNGNNVTSIIRHYFKIQIQMTRFIAKLNNIDTWIFFMGGETFVLPLLAAKIFKKRAILLLPGNILVSSKYSGTRFAILAKLLTTISRKLSKNIIIYSPNLIKESCLEPYCHKILIAHRHFLDFDNFTTMSSLHDRPSLIGYIGRLSGEKGVQHFVNAIPAILGNCQDLQILIGGSGPWDSSIKSYIRAQGLVDRVEFSGWIPHDDLPKYLNKLQLLVLPSYTEGLPNIMIEAMACGTPVLATPVGAIPDVIVDGKTGFIMENNTPECISENVIRAISSPDLEEIAEAGRRFVKENFTFERAVGNWKNILQDTMDKH